jgi:hypothetical protein
LGASAQNGANSSEEFAWIKWLGKIVIRPNFQPQDSIDVFSPRGQDQHRNDRLRAQPTQNVQTAHARQHEIEHDEGMLL